MVLLDTKELAKGYTVVSNTQFDAGLFLLKRLGIAPGNRVLDVGCGPGNLTAHIAELAGKDGSVVGIDPSKERIALAIELEKVTPNLSFFEGRAEDLSHFPPASFGIVFVNSTFHWVQDQPAAIREFARVLKSGGRLGISSGSGDYVAAHEKIKADKGGPKFIKQCELETLLDNSGFSEREIVLDTSSSGATYGGIPLGLRPKAREEMKQEWAKITTEEGIRMEMELLVTVGVKD
ncbi:S-adenosyl-L-methionine-dependent methyltransferase [Acephala macrosclerotiorum]|nr:S-adenosyl-L-methionine-dependent methyltransferase [Acephala macrosclerotiorum]